ncbi:hypothetical protein COCCADRAFT_38175 [Bipolaris zeicola 26-R-13]|uniref:Uncharacterized protein n=1 Tax=Cochliobolus carbonum (strain 26-R-13) TaxID=930089 RepID=W6XWH1_COCC2|nr:uncharacterized protein COCCADRAFT_38175 [Bipolaris zeicola 26-R-13]EUC31762.1 hypothetical protein COCCADRAFT_38175 [Bipolaris zeicola 26-R-13]
MREFPCVYIIFDALDECSGRTELMDILKTMSAWQLENTHMLLTSRKERDIQSSLEIFIYEQSHICLQSERVDKDIQKYVQQRLSNDKDFNRWEKDPTVRQDIETTLVKGAQGMFRWAVCQLDTLAKCRTRAALRRALVTLPPTLDKTYDRILSAISEDDSRYAITILRWLTFAARPLSLGEVAEIVAINLDDEATFDRDEVLEDPLDVLNICSSMVTISTEESETQGPAKQIVVLAHYSVKEYLISDRIQKGSAAHYSMQLAVCHDAIARSCLGYLLQFQGVKMLSHNNAKEFRLADYSAMFWIEHVRMTNEQTEWCSQEAIILLSEKSDVYVNWLRIHTPGMPWKGSNFQRSLQSMPLPFYYAGLLGLKRVVKLLLNAGADVNAQGGLYGNALQAASVKGHEQIVKILLNAGADVNAQGGLYGNALQAASVEGHEQIVKILLNAGADVNAQGGLYSNALYTASVEGHEQILLVSKIDNTQLQDPYNRTLLWWAAAGGQSHTTIVLVSQYHHDLQITDKFGRSPLWIATKKSHREVLEFLSEVLRLTSTFITANIAQMEIGVFAKTVRKEVLIVRRRHIP